MVRMRPAACAAFVVFGALAMLPTSACLVDVDEGLLSHARDASLLDGDSESAAPYAGFPCGATHCQPPGQVCCAKQFGDPDVANGVCSTKDLCKSGDYFACTSPRDCHAAALPGTTCCAIHDRGAFNLTRCEAACDATSSTLCDPEGSACPSPRRCLPSPEFPKLFECLAPP